MQQRVLYVQFTNPAAYPPLEHSSHILADDGWRVLFLGIGALGSADAFEFLPHPNIEVRRLPFVPAGLRQKVLYLRFLLWVIFWSVRWRPRWIYASDLYACPVAWLVSLFSSARVIYHEHDAPSEKDNDQTSFVRFALRTRRLLAQRAAFCVLPNEQRGEVFAAQTNTSRSILTVWNCPRRDEVTGVIQAIPANRADGRLKLYYHGTIVPVRVPTSIIQALALLSGQADLFVLGYETIGSVGYSTDFLTLARKLGVEDHIVIDVQGLSRNQIFAECSRHHVGLSLITAETLQDNNHKHFVGASNKPFDYMASGLALLVPDLDEWVQTYVDPGFGLSCNPDDPESIAEALRWFVHHPDERRAMGERGRQKILTEWNYDKQFKPVLNRMTIEE